jgi:hypothetical protein
MNNMKRILYIAILLTIFARCSEDWLDTYPLGNDTELNFYSSFDAVNMTVTAAYGNYCVERYFDVVYLVLIGGTPSDDIECGGENIFDAYNFGWDLFQFSPSDQPIPNLWGYCYKGIRLANTAIEKFKIIQKTAPDNQLTLIKNRVAEMKFIRAFNHFLIAQVYGGGPYVTELVIPEDFTSTSRVHLTEFYAMMEKDLLEAIPDLLSRTELDAEDVGRATKGAAQALLGKVYLYESSYAANYAGDERFTGMRNLYTEALQQFEAVMNAPGYELIGLDSSEVFTSWWNSNNSTNSATWGKVGAYRWMFTADADNSPESVWEIQHIQDNLAWLRTRGTYLTIFTTPRRIKTKSGTPALGEMGWSFNSPSKYLEQAFGNNDVREDGLLSSSEKYSGSLDPRYPVTISKEGDSLLYEANGQTWVLVDMVPNAKKNVPTGMLCRKYEASPAEFWNVYSHHQESPVNIKYIRMGDVYLMAAEAALMSGNSEKALQYVNAVRKRARYSGVTDGYPSYTGYPKDLTSVTLNDIMHERRIELGGEGHRYFDLVRWNRTEFFNVEVAERETNAQFVKGKHEFLPVPLTEIQSSEGAIKQNPNY